MTNTQLIKLLGTNRELIQRNNAHAIEHLQMLKSDYGHITDGEVGLQMELNNSLVEIHFNSDYRKAISNSLKAIDKYSHCEHKNLIARHYWLIGHSYANNGEYGRADEYLRMCLTTLEAGEGYVATKCDTLMALAMNEEFRNKGKGSSLHYLLENMKLLENEQQPIRMAACQMGLGNVYINMGKVDEALKNYHLAAETYEQFFDLANMASAYSNLGTCYFNLKEYAECEKFLQKSLDLRLKFGSPDHVAISQFNLGVVYKATERFEDAYDLLLKSKETFTRTGNQHYLDGVEEILQEITLKMPLPATS